MLFRRGIRLQVAARSCAHVSCSGGRAGSKWHGGAPMVTAVMALNNDWERVYETDEA